MEFFLVIPMAIIYTIVLTKIGEVLQRYIDNQKTIALILVVLSFVLGLPSGLYLAWLAMK